MVEKETLDVIRETIKETVNGKIDRLSEDVKEQKDEIRKHNEKHENDMQEVKKHIERTTPIVEAYDGFITMGKSAKVIGDAIKWIAGVITAIGLLWVLAKNFFLK